MIRLVPGIVMMGGTLLTEPALAAQLGGAPDEGPSVWRILGALLLCALFALAGGLLLKARQGDVGPWLRVRNFDRRRLTLVDSIKLSPQLQICIVNCDGQEMLLSASASNVTLLRDLPKDRGEAS